MSTPNKVFQLHYPEELPVSERRGDVLNALKAHQVVLICGETGSGKTTQLPKIALEAACVRFGTDAQTGLPASKARLACTQPRRLAASSVAQRVAEELRVELGQEVGYQVRFQRLFGQKTALKFMTEGILLAEIARDPQLKAYHSIILDEVHERSSHMDFLLGYLKTLLPQRPELQLILSSATLEIERLQDFFGGQRVCPALQIQGRTYPVEIQYQKPLSAANIEMANRGAKKAQSHSKAQTRKDIPPFEDLPKRVLRGVAQLRAAKPEADILVFLPGEREISEASKLLEEQALPQTVILPLHGRLPLSSQQQIFHPSSAKRIILSTNIAETSLTIPRIHAVIDSGLHRLNRWSAQSGIQRLQLESISQANARQRAGRCGRLGPGICLRLYSEEEFEEFFEFPDPEIRRESLSHTILQMKELGLPDPREFPFLDPPSPKLISSGMRELQRLQALDQKRQLTVLGRKLARLPLDPPLARFLLAAAGANAQTSEELTQESPLKLTWTSLCAPACVLAAALTVQDPRERPPEKRELAQRAHAQWVHPESDFLGWIKLWEEIAHCRREDGKLRINALRKFAAKNFLNWRRVLEWDQLAQEFAQSLVGLIEPNAYKKRKSKRLEEEQDSLESPNSESRKAKVRQLLPQVRLENTAEEPLHLALLTALPWNIGFWDKEAKLYRCPRQPFALFPGSTLFSAEKRPRWVLGWDLATTSRTWARQVARIKPQWLEMSAPHLCQSHFHSPQLDAALGTVSCLENVTLGGLRIISNRRRHYGAINPSDAHAIFVRDGLLDNQLELRARFLEILENRRYEAQVLEAKLRQNGQLLSLEQIEAWFFERIPAQIHSKKAFQQWYSSAKASAPEILHIPLADCLVEELNADELATLQAEYPDEVYIYEQSFPLYYAHALGDADDGITLGLHIDQLANFPEASAHWLVPGLVRLQAEALLRQLPKAQRVLLQPYKDTLDAFIQSQQSLLENPEQAQQSLADALQLWLRKERGLTLFADAFAEEELSPELRLKFWICDDQGEELALGENLSKLRAQLGVQLQARAQKATGMELESQAAQTWQGLGEGFQELPEKRKLPQGTLYPCLIDQGEQAQTVIASALPRQLQAQRQHRAGLARLLQLAHPKFIQDIVKSIRFEQNLKLQLPLLTQAKLEPKRLVQLAAELSFSQPLPRTAVHFAQEEAQARAQLHVQLQKLLQVLSATGRIASEVNAWVEKHQEKLALAPTPQHHIATDLSQQLQWMLRPTFLDAGQGEFLLQTLPRILASLQERLQRLQEQPARDLQAMEQLSTHWQAWWKAWQSKPKEPSLLEHGELLDELRIFLFTPHHPRPEKISLQRVEKAWMNLTQIMQ